MEKNSKEKKSKYLIKMFETSEFNINEHGIDLKKNYQIFKHIDYKEITLIEIKNGFLIRNWMLSLSVGIIVFISASIWCIYTINSSDFTSLPQRSIKLYMAINFTPWILLLCGLILIIVSLKRNLKMIIHYNKTINWSNLKEIEKAGKINGLIDFLEGRTKVLILKKAINSK